MIEVELTSADPEFAVNTSSVLGTALYSIERINEYTTRFQIKRKDWEKLNSILQKRGEKPKIINQKGVYFCIKNLLHRPIFFVGIMILVFILIFLPTRVLFVRTEGNINISTGRILEAGEACGICFGASRRSVRSEMVKNALLEALPELKWAGVNTKGCVAVISVRERTESKTEQEDTYSGSIIAARDGIITSCSVMEGTAACVPGQAVKKGQILISEYTDCGLSIRVKGAEGEVYAQTERELAVIVPSQTIKKYSIIGQMRKISLLIGKKRINLWKGSGIWDTTCDRMYKEYYLALPGDNQLPIALAIDFGTCYQISRAEENDERIKESVTEYAKCYLYQHMVSGKLLSASENITATNGMIYMSGKYTCTEMIGMVQRGKNGEEYGEND